MTCIITDFGAVGDGKTLNTAAIQSAIDACTAAGGGRVTVPAGKFLSGTVLLKSNVELHLETGAELISSLDPADMPDLMGGFEDDNRDTGWEGGCFLLARHAENVTISGFGCIDGRGREVFYEDDDDGGSHESPLKVRGYRPRMSFLEDVQNLTVKDVTFRDAAFWTLHMAGCRNVLIDGIRIENNERVALAPPYDHLRILSDPVPVTAGIARDVVDHDVVDPSSVPRPDADAARAVLQNTVAHGDMVDVAPGLGPDFERRGVGAENAV